MNNEQLRIQMEALANRLEESANTEPDERLFKTCQRDARAAKFAYKKCVKFIRKVLAETGDL
jgi:hypothetical protein